MEGIQQPLNLIYAQVDIRQSRQNIPTEGSRSASFRSFTKACLDSREIGFILKFPPTKNWRVMVEKDGGLSEKVYRIDMKP